MKTKIKLYNRGTRLHYLSAIFFSLLVVMIFQNYYLPATEHRSKVVKEEEQLAKEVKILRKELAVLENKCEALKSNEPGTVEKVIREEFGWGKSNEVLLTTPNNQQK